MRNVPNCGIPRQFPPSEHPLSYNRYLWMRVNELFIHKDRLTLLHGSQRETELTSTWTTSDWGVRIADQLSIAHCREGALRANAI